MAKRWEYPRWRRYAMQGVMWVILAASVGFAALVNHGKRQGVHVDLGEPRQIGPLTVQLPAGWDEIETESGTICVLREPLEMGRHLNVRYAGSSILMRMFGDNYDVTPRTATPLKFGDWSGSFWTIEKSVPIPTLEGIRRVRSIQVIGLAHSPDGGGTLRIELNGQPRPSEPAQSIELLKRIAETVRVGTAAGPPPP